jgi:hypothetical protein
VLLSLPADTPSANMAPARLAPTHSLGQPARHSNPGRHIRRAEHGWREGGEPLDDCRRKDSRVNGFRAGIGIEDSDNDFASVRYRTHGLNLAPTTPPSSTNHAITPSKIKTRRHITSANSANGTVRVAYGVRVGSARTRRLSRNPQLRTLMAAWIAFQSGNFAHSVLIVVFSYSAGGVAAAGAATVLRVLPGGLLAPLASSLATSARPQLHLSIGIGSRCAASAATIAAILGGAPVGVVLALVAADSLMAAAVRPLHGALVVQLADTTAQAAAANAATSSLLSAGALAGPALAGLALGLVGVGWAFVVPAAVFAAGSIIAQLIKVPAAEDAPKTGSSRSSGRYMRSRLRAIGAGYRAIAHKRQPQRPPCFTSSTPRWSASFSWRAPRKPATVWGWEPTASRRS